MRYTTTPIDLNEINEVASYLDALLESHKPEIWYGANDSIKFRLEVELDHFQTELINESLENRFGLKILREPE